MAGHSGPCADYVNLSAPDHDEGTGWRPLFRLQLQRRRIDAVAQAIGPGAVIEDVAEMAVAFRAQHLGAHHAVADVALLVDMAVIRRPGKTRPAAAGIELGVGLEQRLAAAGASIGALAVLMLVFAGERTLGRLLAQYGILHRRQFLAPLGFALLDFVGRLGVGHWNSSKLDPVIARSEATKQSISTRKGEWIASLRSQ